MTLFSSLPILSNLPVYTLWVCFDRLAVCSRIYCLDTDELEKIEWSNPFWAGLEALLPRMQRIAADFESLTFISCSAEVFVFEKSATLSIAYYSFSLMGDQLFSIEFIVSIYTRAGKK